MISKLFSRTFSIIPEIGIKQYIRAFVHRIRYKEYVTYFRNGVWELHYPGFVIRYYDVPSAASTNYLFFKKFVDRKFDIIIDAGGFMGTYGFLMACKYPNAKIYIFEADPANYLKIKSNIELNDFHNVVLEPVGLWSKADDLKMSVNKNLASSLLTHDDGVSEIDIHVVSLDEYFESIKNKFVFIKMNIEGAEIAALEGASTFITNNKVDLAISTDHYVNGELTFTKIEELLADIGLQSETIFDGIHINTYSSNFAHLR
jgi:FkbM family methyltransferase